MSEEKILVSAKIAILCHSFINVYENLMVFKGKARMPNGVGFIPRKNSGDF